MRALSIAATGMAAEGIISERARETWDGLIATPLDGRTILRAKMIGAAWRVRWGLILLGVYQVFVYRTFSGKVVLGAGAEY